MFKIKILLPPTKVAGLNPKIEKNKKDIFIKKYVNFRQIGKHDLNLDEKRKLLKIHEASTIKVPRKKLNN